MEIPQQQKMVIENLLKSIQDMSPEEFKKMLMEFNKFHKYSFFNKCLVYAAGASQVAGYKQWQDKHKRQVLEKAKHKIGAIQILAPKIGYFVSTDDGLNYARTTQKKFENWEGKKKSYPIDFFTVTVFDISDTEGDPIPEIMTPKANISLELVLNAAKELGFNVESKPLEFSLGGYIEGKNIVLNSNRQESANVGTLIHELAHGLLGHTDTNCSHETDIKEVQAETVTYLVCQSLGIERNSAFYLKSWGASQNILNDFSQLSKVADKLTNSIRSNSMRFIMED